MSFDVHLLQAGDNGSDPTNATLDSLRPYLVAGEMRLATADGGAEVYGLETRPIKSVMFTHVDGHAAWDVIYSAAVAGSWAVVPVGGDTCIVDPRHALELPAELVAGGFVLVTSGEELRVAATA
ncbi:hypothetical protein [Microbacterium sp. LWH10-1.2]|uniref:hypothetical protein n=1 Tax=Microbacterium sp. LWH10-1.2 TaxID=3135255 RepID=UPI003138732B